MTLIPHIGAGAFSQEEEKLKKTMQKAQMESGQNQAEESESFGRNELVKIEKDGEIKELKWKKAEEMIAEGWKLVK